MVSDVCPLAFLFTKCLLMILNHCAKISSSYKKPWVPTIGIDKWEDREKDIHLKETSACVSFCN